MDILKKSFSKLSPPPEQYHRFSSTESLWEDSLSSDLGLGINILTKEELDVILNSTMNSTISNVFNTTVSNGYGSLGPIGSSINSSSSFISINSGANAPWPGTVSTSPLKVTGTAEFDGDVVIKGRNLMESLDAIEKRLAILVPDPAKLEHFEALKKAYDHYKMLEAMCQLPSVKNDE